MNKIKVMTVVGTRPEIIRLSRVISALDENVEHKLIHTGQNYDYELNEIFFEELGVRKPDYFLNAAGNNSATTIGNIIIKVDEILEIIQPDAFLVLGDTNSCMAVLPAKRRKIPIFHIEAGNRCFDQRVPEEINRKIVDHTSDINLTYSSIAREYLVNEGFPADRIIKVGSPMNEVLMHYKDKIMGSKILEVLKLKKSNYFLISAHREEQVDNPAHFEKFINLLNWLAKEFKLPVIVSTHPRTRSSLNKINSKIDTNIRFLKPLGFLDYNYLQINSKAVLSDSGTITEESSILNFHALNIRDMHERPEGMEEASVMLVGLEKNNIASGLNLLSKQKTGNDRTLRKVYDYDVNNFSDKIVRIIISYIGYVNRVVWKKY